MAAWILEKQTLIRVLSFLVVLAIFGGIEMTFPRRQRMHSQWKRWLSNLGLSFLNAAFLRFFVVMSPVGIALIAHEQDVGVLHMLELPLWLAALVSIVILDMVIYFQHIAFHKTPILWELHKVHHSDQDLDVSSALRFHTIEMLLSFFIKGVAVYLLGAPAFSVILFEVLLNGTALFNHSNFSLPSCYEKRVRSFLVTPDMHRVHHSVDIAETNSNYGFNLSCWDRIFGTYCSEPAKGQDGMMIGLHEYQRSSPLNMRQLLALPFDKKIFKKTSKHK